jgi:hypothetical protein
METYLDVLPVCFNIYLVKIVFLGGAAWPFAKYECADLVEIVIESELRQVFTRIIAASGGKR